MRALAWYVARLLLLAAAAHACGEAQSDMPEPAAPVMSVPAMSAANSVMPGSGLAQAGSQQSSGGAPPATGNTSAADSGPATGRVPAADGGSKIDVSASTDADAGTVDEPASDVKIVAADLSAITQAWWAYERAPSYTVVTSQVKVPMRDGIELACTLSRPATNGSAAPGKFPGLVVELTPYALQGDTYNTEAAFFTTRGYNALVCTVRGTGDSGGTWQHAFSRSDGRDAYDLVEWLATQPFSDERVGQLGESYGGQTSYGAAVEQAPHLRAIAPMQPPADLYDNVIFPGGIEALPDGAINNWPPIAELLSLGRISAQDEYASDRAHPTYDEYWQNRTLLGRHAAIQVPVLTIGGWQDSYFRSGTLMNIEGALDRTWAIYGPWVHMPPVDLGTCDVACAEDPLPSGVILAWMDHWVMELADLPIPERPSFVSFENPKGASRGFRELSAWVPEGAMPVVYELGSDGTLSEHAAATAALTLHQPTEPSAALSFTTAPLERDRVLLGHAALDFRAQLSAADAHFYVQLFDLDAAGKETFVNDGFLKASHRASHTTPSPVPLGEFVDYHIAIRPQHHRFAAGHRVLIRIWSGPRQDLAQPQPVDVTLETGASARLRLPGFAGEL
jgi:predicted acyl esterase